MSNASARLGYRPEIDGLRALAVLPVMLFHAGFSLFSGGYVGVDIFFVISGYLITGIILQEIDQGSFSIWRFYERRARRILPALLLVIAVTTIFAWLWMLPEQWEDYAESLVAVALFASNILFWLQDDYFAGASEEKPLLHSWSLAVEEQFYILFPLILLLVMRRRGTALLPVIMVIGLLSLCWAEYASRTWPSANFYLLPSRVWELMAGAVCAVIMRDNKGAAAPSGRWAERVYGARSLAAPLGLIMIVAAIIWFTPETRVPSLWGLLPVGGTMLLILFAQQGTLTARILSWRPFVAVGLISYGAYLWHQPILAFYRLKSFSHDPVVLAGLLLLALILAWISYILVEQPIRFRLLKNRSAHMFVVLSAVLLSILAAVGLAGRYAPPELPHQKRYGTAQYSGEGYGWREHFAGSRGNVPGIIVYGDSLARQYINPLRDEASRNGRAMDFVGAPACISLPHLFSQYKGQTSDQCRDMFTTLQAMSTADPEAAIIIAQDWGPQLFQNTGEQYGTGNAEHDPLAAKALLTAIERLLTILPPTHDIVLIGHPPEAGFASVYMTGGPARCKQYWDGQCPASFPQNQARLQNINAELATLAARHSHVAFVNPYDALCADNICYIERNGAMLYYDSNHFTHGPAYAIGAMVIEALNMLEAGQ